jgi:integrase
VQASVRARTADNYRSQVEHHLIPALGGHKLAGLRVPHVLAWRNDQLARGDHPRSVSHRLTTLKVALEQAVRWEMLATNPAAKVPGPHVPQSDRKPLTVAQARAFLAHVAGDQWEAIYVLALTLGMRQAEILGLRWVDVQLGRSDAVVVRGARSAVASADGMVRADEAVPVLRRAGDSADILGEAQRLVVRKTLVWLHGKPRLEDPKTERSHRTLELHSRAVAALVARQKAQRVQRLGNPAWSPHFDAGYDFVFSDPDGYPLERTVVTRAFARHLRALDLPAVDFRSTRHTAVDWLNELGMTMREVADVVGHSRPSQTSDTYSWLGNKATTKAAKLLDEELA